MISFLSPLRAWPAPAAASHLVLPSKVQNYCLHQFAGKLLNSVAAALLLAAATRQPQRRCCNAAAATRQPQRCCNAAATTRLLQRGCCNAAAATLLLQRCCCNAAAATRLLQRCCCNAAAATRLLQRGCCNAVAATLLLLLLRGLLDPDWWSNWFVTLLITCTYRPVRIYRLPSSSILFAWNLTPEMRICSFMPTSSDSISGVQLEIIRRATGRFQKTHYLLIWTPPPIENSPSRRRLKFFSAPATPPPPMSFMIFAAADLYLISVRPWDQHSLEKGGSWMRASIGALGHRSDGEKTER